MSDFIAVSLELGSDEERIYIVVGRTILILLYHLHTAQILLFDFVCYHCIIDSYYIVDLGDNGLSTIYLIRYNI